MKNLDLAIDLGKKIFLLGCLLLGVLLLLSVIINVNLGIVTRFTSLLSKVSMGQWMGVAIIILLLKQR